MPTLTIFELDADPIGTADVTITAEYFVEVVDNDAQLEDPDGDGSIQFNTSTMPADFIGNSSNLQIFETYTGTAPDGSSVTFTLIQYSSSLYMFVTDGSIDVGETISGTNNGITAATPSNYTDLPDYVCFTAGSLVETPGGPVAIETLKPHDLVCVAGDQPKEVRWIGKRHLSAREVWVNPHLRPVRIKANALGPGLPARDVRVSQQHRIAVTATDAELMFETNEFLVPARFLVDGKKIVIEEGPRDVEFVHVLFDQHELVNVAGLWSESFFLGDTVTGELSHDVRAELLELFPELEQPCAVGPVTKFKVLKRFEAEAMGSKIAAYQTSAKLH